MSGTDLAGFLLARIAEDEAVAREARQHEYLSARRDSSVIRWENDASGYAFISATSGRILAECEAKRLVGSFSQIAASDSPLTRRTLTDVLEMLALPYADHPDYRQEWKP